MRRFALPSLLAALVLIAAFQSAARADSSRAAREKRRLTDTVYSWQPLGDVIGWAAGDPRGKLYRGDYLYAWRTPAATFAYGEVPVRVKLREGVTFKEIDPSARNCTLRPEAERRATVYIVPNFGPDTVVDYLLCSPEVIESWSFGLAQTAREVEADGEATIADPLHADLYSTYFRDWPQLPFGKVDNDDSEWTVPAYRRKIELLRALATSTLPRVFCANGTVGVDCATEHFRSRFPKPWRAGSLEPGARIAVEPLRLGEADPAVYVEAALAAGLERAAWGRLRPVLIVPSATSASAGPFETISREEFSRRARTAAGARHRLRAVVADAGLRAEPALNFLGADSGGIRDALRRLESAVTVESADPRFARSVYLRWTTQFSR